MMDTNSAQKDQRYRIDVAGDGRITLVIEPGVGLGQDFFLDVHADLQNRRSQLVIRQQAEASNLEAAKPRWWPAEVLCTHCARKTKLDTEPASYAVFCPGCTTVIVIEPITPSEP